MRKFVLALFLVMVLAGAAFGDGAPRLTDFEHHFYTPESLEFMAKLDPKGYPYYDAEKKEMHVAAGVTVPLGSIPAGCDIEEIGPARIAAMTRAGIDVAYLSHSTGFEEISNLPGAVELARSINDTIAEAVKKYPDRFRGTITLPVGNVEEALKEMERCVKELGFRVWHTHSSYVGLGHLDDDKYRPLLKKAAELGIPVYIHPHVTSFDRINEMGGAVAGAGFGFGVDVMTTTLRLMVKGVFDDLPAGSYNLFVEIDPDDEISEIHEGWTETAGGNNTGYRPFAVIEEGVSVSALQGRLADDDGAFQITINGMSPADFREYAAAQSAPFVAEGEIRYTGSKVLTDLYADVFHNVTDPASGAEYERLFASRYIPALFPGEARRFTFVADPERIREAGENAAGPFRVALHQESKRFYGPSTSGSVSSFSGGGGGCDALAGTGTGLSGGLALLALVPLLASWPPFKFAARKFKR